MNHRSCSECEWWQGGKTNQWNNTPGTCRVLPPKVVEGFTVWPKTNRNDWCGSFTPKDRK